MYIKEEMKNFHKEMEEKERLKKNIKKAIYRALVDSGMMEKNPDKEIYVNSQKTKYKVNITLEEV